MANTVTGFYQTLVAAATEASRTLVGKTSLLDQVYRDFQPIAASPGQALSIPIPVSVTSQITDIGTGDFTPADQTAQTVTLTFNQHPGYCYIVRDLEQWNTPAQIRAVFLDSAIKAVAEFINGKIAALLTSANLGTGATPIAGYNPINGATAGTIAQADIQSAWSNLATNKIPVSDLGNFFLTCHPNVYGSMLGSTFWSANSQVGYELAGQTRRQAMLGEQFGAMTDFDQQMPAVIGQAVTGTSVGVTNGSAAVTGSGTSFTTQLAVGQYLTFASDTTATPYRILSITSNTALTLATNYAGTTAAATQATVTGYTNVLWHRHAVALGLRLMPNPDPRVVDFMTIYWKGVPIMVKFGYNQLKGGWVVTLDTGFALGVIRANHAQLITC
jgi:hypothetical protein